MDEIKAKQQIVEKIKDATTILVTVSDSPSVDALSAALGLTLLFDKMEKHPTAIFSGDVPPAIAFLEPEKTFDTTTDSLRDFIIALDKEKADHLRYKVEGDSVKIFITPYKTTITDQDLEYSQGDYNVELVIALGVDNQDHLDKALEAHGQILHDADIITLSAGDNSSDLGGIDWHDDQASSLSEMVAGLAEALKADKKKSLLNAAIATAFLTGIVAETDRFSNTHTTSRVMTTAAQLMAAGADQQLIATKLQEAQEIDEQDDEPSENSRDDQDDANDETPEEVVEEKPKDRSILSITHEPSETLEQMDKRVKAAEEEEAVKAANEALSEHVEAQAEEAPVAPEPVVESAPEAPVETAPAPTPAPTPEVEEQRPFIETPAPVEDPVVEAPVEAPAPSAEPDFIATPLPTEAPAPTIPEMPAPIEAASAQAPTPSSAYAPAEPTLGDMPAPAAVGPVVSQQDEVVQPGFGGTLNATTEQAADDARREEESDQNKTTLSHSYLAGSAESAAPSAAYAPEGEQQAPSAQPADMQPTPEVNQASMMGHELVIQPPADMNVPTPGPVDLGLPMPPSLPDFGAPAQPAVGTPYAFEPQPVTQPELLGDILKPEPSTSTNPFGPQAEALPPIPPAPQPPTSPSTDPGQFRIPGQ